MTDQKVGSYDDVDDDPAGAATLPSNARPFGLVGLTASLGAIVIVALLLCVVAVGIALLILTARIGTTGRIEFLQDLRFDFPLRLRLGAGAIGVFYVAIAGSTLAVAAWRGGRSWPALVALDPPHRAWRQIAALFGASLAYAALATLILEHLRAHGVIVDGPTDVVLAGTIVTNLVLLAPIAEELVFRGWLYTGLRGRLGFWPAFLVTAIAFAAIHYDPSHRRFLLVLPLAVALGLLRETTGSIRPTILLHGCYNLIVVAITLANT